MEGKNIIIEWRYAEGKLELLSKFAAELVRLKVDIIVSAGPTVTRLAKEATVTIPIVMALDDDPVGLGLCRQPRATRWEHYRTDQRFRPELSGKQLELLKETHP